HDFQHQGIACHGHARDVFALSQDDRPDPDGLRFPNGFAQQNVRGLAAFAWHEIVWGVEVARINVSRGHEFAELDGWDGGQRGLAEIRIREHDEFALAILVSLHDVTPRNSLTVCGADTLQLDGRVVPVVEQTE